MADFSAIRTGIQTRIVTITDFVGRAHAVWPESIKTPCCIVRPVRWDYRQAMGNVNRGVFEIVVLAGPTDQSMVRSQQKLDGYLDDTGASSIKAALEGDKTLGGNATTLHVPGFRDYGELEVNGIGYIGAKVEVEVWP